MNKINLKSPFNKELTDNIFNFIFNEIRRIVLLNNKFEISELGDFEVIHRKMQTVTDMGKKSEILLPPKNKIVFKPSRELINRLKD